MNLGRDAGPLDTGLIGGAGHVCATAAKNHWDGELFVGDKARDSTGDDAFPRCGRADDSNFEGVVFAAAGHDYDAADPGLR